MRPKLRVKSASVLIVAGLASAAGCLVVTPIDDLPSEQARSNQGGKSSGGESSQAGARPTSGSGGVPDAGASSGGGSEDGAGKCQTNADCTTRSADEPYRCRPADHTCVALKSDLCPIAIGKAADPNALYFGAFTTFNRATPADNAIIWAMDLAREELSGDLVRGLPDGPDAARRPLVMVVCSNTEADVDESMRHLADDVQVPAVIANLKPGPLLHAFEAYLKRDIFYLSPVSVTMPIIAESDDNHIWNLLGQPSDLAPTYVEVLKLAEERVRNLYHITSPDPLKVALVTTNDAYDAELANALRPVLQVNGKSIAANGAAFGDFTIPDKPDFVAMAKKIRALEPDIVISAASEQFLMNGGLQDELEADWDSVMPAKRHPFYILSPFNAGNLTDLTGRIGGALERSPGVDDQRRYVGISIASAVDNTLQNAYALRLNSAHDNPLNDTANYYDAVYYLAYAMYGANQPSGITGTGITAGMQRLLNGDDFNVGPDAISSTFDALAKKAQTVHVVSTLGPPGFDPTTGVRPVSGSVFCFERMGSAVRPSFDVLRYDKAKKALTGDGFPCIPGFFVP